jgi:predicted pyridoxine 5'-phosphate oxidase superfamily flavin-nucleotide-binding protein
VFVVGLEPPLAGERLAFADYKGNRQLISTGNLASGSRVALFLMDYPGRTRLKILGHARVEDARSHPDLVTLLSEPERRTSVERLFFIDVIAFDWNCSQHITPRYVLADVEKALGPLQEQAADLANKLKTRGKHE